MGNLRFPVVREHRKRTSRKEGVVGETLVSLQGFPQTIELLFFYNMEDNYKTNQLIATLITSSLLI